MEEQKKKGVPPTLTREEARFWLDVWAVEVSGHPFARVAMGECVEGFLQGRCVVIWRMPETGERMTALPELPQNK